jgi:hypothetical protein
VRLRAPGEVTGLVDRVQVERIDFLPREVVRDD